MSWMISFTILASSTLVSAQCNPPNAFWLHAPQSSNALVFNWSSVSGATQYQVRYWESANPGDQTIVDNFAPAPATLSGLKSNTQYKLEIRSKCGSSYSAWGTTVSYLTANSTASCSTPTGVSTLAGNSFISVSWTSSGSHTIRYRMGTSGEWIIPPGALSVSTSPFSIAGLSTGSYQVEVKSNCGGTSSDFIRSTINIGGGGCATPIEPFAAPGATNALVALPGIIGATGFNVDYSVGMTGIWINAGNNIPPSNYFLNPPLQASTQYQVRIQAICPNGNSSFSPAATFTTQAFGACLLNKNFGKNLSAADALVINNKFNTPSPFSFGSMIGVNDGGLIFRSFQNESSNQITQLTTQFRNFHTMDEDFDNSLVEYSQNIKPKDTSPEGTPSYMAYNKSLYNVYRNTHGFANITAATELLQYSPQSWKDKIYLETDWSASGPAGIKESFENYTLKFIDELAPPNGAANQLLVTNFQVGNELWDYPVKIDYQNLLLGARSAFVRRYGQKSNGNWKMKLVAGSFQAFRDNNCGSMNRDVSNCGGELKRHDFIGDYLDLANCDVLKDLDAVDCHPYSFVEGTNRWTFPEAQSSETWQIRNLAGWLNANQNAANGVLVNTQLWSTEFGFDSDSYSGVGEKTQSAYLLRGLLMHSRYHYEKVFFYNAYDQVIPSNQNYHGLYNSAGFWRMGTNPANNAPSPLVAYGATPKPSWYGMLDMKTRFGSHVFYKALVEDADANIWLIALPDGSDPYLVFWDPRRTDDTNINQNFAINKAVNWSGILSGNYKVESPLGQLFAESNAPGATFQASSGGGCDATNITTIRLNPAFIRLVSCSACANITNPGSIIAPNPNSGMGPFDPGIIANGADATGGTGVIVYQWQQSLDNVNFTDINGANLLTYNPPSLNQTTYFRRASKRTTCSEFFYTPAVVITLQGGSCATVLSFQRYMNTDGSCNSAGDYYYEIVLNAVTSNDEIILEGLPSNGVNVTLSSLNDVAFTTPAFHANLQYLSINSLKWLVNKNNGATQKVKIFYCWVNNYPEPVSITTVTSMCSGIITECSSPNMTGPGSEDRSDVSSSKPTNPFQFLLQPNPGTDQITLTYLGTPATLAMLRIISLTGELMSTGTFSDIEDQQQLQVEATRLPPGFYYLFLEVNKELRLKIWEKL